MGNRLSKIYTRTGDDGTTGLGDGSRTPKDSLRVDAYGTVDEANSAIGIVLSFDSVPGNVRTMLTEVQHDLFELGGGALYSGTQRGNGRVRRPPGNGPRCHSIADLPRLKEFILPGGGQAAAACHLARTIVRRAERRVKHIGESGKPAGGSLAVPQPTIGFVVRGSARSGACPGR